MSVKHLDDLRALAGLVVSEDPLVHGLGGHGGSLSVSSVS
jgi:hypothetical protein